MDIESGLDNTVKFIIFGLGNTVSNTVKFIVFGLAFFGAYTLLQNAGFIVINNPAVQIDMAQAEDISNAVLMHGKYGKGVK